MANFSDVYNYRSSLPKTLIALQALEYDASNNYLLYTDYVAGGYDVLKYPSDPMTFMMLGTESTKTVLEEFTFVNLRLGDVVSLRLARLLFYAYAMFGVEAIGRLKKCIGDSGGSRVVTNVVTAGDVAFINSTNEGTFYAAYLAECLALCADFAARKSYVSGLTEHWLLFFRTFKLLK